MSTQPHSDPDYRDGIWFAETGEGVIVVRIRGRGTFANSANLKKLAHELAQKYKDQQKLYAFVLDLQECETMDSTFMGTLAAIGLQQKRDCGTQVVVVRPDPHVLKLLQTLGLHHILSVRSGNVAEQPSLPPTEFKAAEHHSLSRLEQIVDMLEAHKTLCDVDSGNVARFVNVLEYLNQSLRRERGEK